MIFFSGRLTLLVIIGATFLLICCMILGIFPERYLSDVQSIVHDHSNGKTAPIMKSAKFPTTERFGGATTLVPTTAYTSLPTIDQSTYPATKVSVIPPKRYGTYVENIDESCLTDNCVYDEKSPNIWAKEKVSVKVIPENEVDTFVRKRLLERIIENDTREEFDLLLTPPMITVWAYELGFALTEGICLCNVKVRCF